MNKVMLFLLTVSLFLQSTLVKSLEATAPCLTCIDATDDSHTVQVQNLCRSMLLQCQDVPQEKRMSCESNPFVDQTFGAVGCIMGVFKSAEDLLKFIYEIAKFLIIVQMKAVKMGAQFVVDVVQDPIGVAKQVQGTALKITHAQAMNIAQLSNYVVREFEVSRRKVGMVFAISDMAKRIMGPIVKTIWNEIDGFVAKQVHNYNCYNIKERAEMVCKVIADFVFPPAALIALLKGGGKKILQEFPKISSALKRITENIAESAEIATKETKHFPNNSSAIHESKQVVDSEIRMNSNIESMLVDQLVDQTGSFAPSHLKKLNLESLTPDQRKNLHQKIEAVKSKIKEVKKYYASILDTANEDKRKIISLIIQAENKGIPRDKIEGVMRRAEKECGVP